MFQRAGVQRHRIKRHGVGLLPGWLGWGEESSLGCLWLGEVAGREPEAVQEIRRDVQAAGLQLVGGVSSRRGWRLRISAVVHIGGPVAEVLGVGVVHRRLRLPRPRQTRRLSACFPAAASCRACGGRGLRPMDLGFFSSRDLGAGLLLLRGRRHK